MTTERFQQRIAGELAEIEAAGLTKPERILASEQGAEVRIALPSGGARTAINMCANNYLGLAGDPRIGKAAAEAALAHGAGFASVRFICGTHEMHKALEQEIARYLRKDDAILFAAAFDANAAVFEALFDEHDAILSDALNHASLIDGIRLCKAKRFRFRNGDLDDLEHQLQAARTQQARDILIVTDGVFSMDGIAADLASITQLAHRYGALVLVDDCHATGFVGEGGRGSAAQHGVEDGIHIVTGTFGKALGGSMGGFIAASGEVVRLLRQRARPYLFSNALPPAICGASLAALEIVRSVEGDVLRGRLLENAAALRGGLNRAGFDLVPGDHPIIPVMLGEAKLAQAMAADLLNRGVFVTGFSYPVVPKGQARIRTQVSAAHSRAQVDEVIEVFAASRDALQGAIT